jgi:16S rRNA (guanine(966)-N(2))-methyltransferase RsmD
MRAGTLRIVAGSLKGRRLKAPTWEGLRPTSDKLRETIFNVLAPRLADARVLDGFAGTGALGIEAISRGARTVTFIDRDPRALALIEENLAACGVREACAIIRGGVARTIDAFGSSRVDEPFDVVLLDPPYDIPPETALAGVSGVLASGGIAVIEHARRQQSPERVDQLVRVRHLVSGDSALSLYERAPGTPFHP